MVRKNFYFFHLWYLTINILLCSIGLSFRMAWFPKFVTFVRRKPQESFIAFFLFLFFWLPLRCPNSFSYEYVPYSELDDDLLYCQIKDHRKSVKPFCPEVPKHKGKSQCMICWF